MHRTSRHVTAAEQSRLVFLPYHHIADGLYITAVSSPKPRFQDLIDQFIRYFLVLEFPDASAFLYNREKVFLHLFRHRRRFVRCQIHVFPLYQFLRRIDQERRIPIFRQIFSQSSFLPQFQQMLRIICLVGF